jgi:hypothetical protein
MLKLFLLLSSSDQYTINDNIRPAFFTKKVRKRAVKKGRRHVDGQTI